MTNAVAVKSVTKRVDISLAGLAQAVSSSVWEALGESQSCLQVEVLYLRDGTVASGCEGEVGRFVARVGTAGLRDAGFDDFSAFCDAVVREVLEDGGRCGELRFTKSSAERYGEAVRGLAGTLGWRVEDERGGIVIKKKSKFE